MGNPFTPRDHGTTTVLVDGTNVVQVPISVASTINISNIGDSGLLVEFSSNPLDADSLRIPPRCERVLSRPPSSNILYLKREAGGEAQLVKVTQGYGE